METSVYPFFQRRNTEELKIRERISRSCEKHLQYFFLAPAIVIFVLLAIYPLVYSLNLSLYNISLAVSGTGEFLGSYNYAFALTDFLCLAVGLEFILGLGISILLSNKLMKRRWVVVRSRGFFLLPTMMAPVVIGLTFRLMYHPEFGVLNYFLTQLRIISRNIVWLGEPDFALFSLVVADVWQWTPFIALVMLAGFLAVPEELHEAAEMDGASWFQSFLHITCPLSKRVILIALLIRTMDALKTFDVVYTLTRGGPGRMTELLSFFIYRQGFRYASYSYAAATSILLAIVIIGIATVLVTVLRRTMRA